VILGTLATLKFQRILKLQQGEIVRNADERLAFVEEIAMLVAEDGLPKMTGRVVGWLLVCDPAEQTAAEVAEALQASRGSISGAMRMLTPSGFVERFTKPGDRREYFRLRPESWKQMFERRAQQAARAAAICQRGAALLADEPPESRARIEGLRDLYAFMADEFAEIFQSWERRRKERG